MPLVLSVLLEVQFAHGKLLFKLFATVIVAMALGLFLKARSGEAGERLSPLMRSTSTVFILLLTAVIVLLNYDEVLRLADSGAIFVVFSFIVGHTLWGAWTRHPSYPRVYVRPTQRWHFIYGCQPGADSPVP